MLYLVNVVYSLYLTNLHVFMCSLSTETVPLKASHLLHIYYARLVCFYVIHFKRKGLSQKICVKFSFSIVFIYDIEINLC